MDMKIKYAYVRYLDDKYQTIVPTSYIKKFDDKWDNKTLYSVFWSENMKSAPSEFSELPAGEGTYYKAQILAVGESIKSLMEKRIHVPKLSDSLLEDEDEENVLKEKKQLASLKRKANTKSQLSILEQNESLRNDSEVAAQHRSGKYKKLYCEQVEEMTRLKAMKEIAEEKYLKKKKECKDLCKQKLELLELNLAMQRRLNEALAKCEKKGPTFQRTSTALNNTQTSVGAYDSDETSIMSLGSSIPSPILQSSFQDNSDSKHLDVIVEDGMVIIGGGITINEDKWKLIEDSRTPSLFAKSLSVAVWGSETLVLRTPTGEGCKSTGSSGTKMPLTPQKMDIIKDHLRKYLKKTKDPLANLEDKKLRSLTNKFVGEKIMDLKKAAKRKSVKKAGPPEASA